MELRYGKEHGNVKKKHENKFVEWIGFVDTVIKSGAMKDKPLL